MDWERLAWRESRETFDAFPPAGEHAGYDITYQDFPHIRTKDGRVEGLPLSPDAVDHRWGTEFSLHSVQRGPYGLHYAPIEHADRESGFADYVALVSVSYFTERETTLEAARAGFVEFAMNVTTANRSEATAWSYGFLSETDRDRISRNPDPTVGFSYGVQRHLEFPLRLDELAREQRIADRADEGARHFELDGWAWEFRLTDMRANHRGWTVSVDSGGNSYFSRQAMSAIGEERLKGEAREAFEDLGLPAPSFTRVVYKHETFMSD